MAIFSSYVSLTEGIGNNQFVSHLHSSFGPPIQGVESDRDGSVIS